MSTGGQLGSDATFFKRWKRVVSSSLSTMDNIQSILSPMLQIFRLRASRLHRLGWMAVTLLWFAGELRVSGDEVSGGGGRSWWRHRRGSSLKPSKKVFAMDLSTAWSVPRCKLIGIGCNAMDGGAELESQVFPSVFGGDTMGCRSEERSPLAKMAVMVGLGNSANPT